MITNLKSSSQRSNRRFESPSNPLVVCATDDAYVMPLAVMLCSAGLNLRAGAEMYVCILDGGVTDENKAKLKETLVDLPIEIEWISFEAEILQQFQVSHHVSHTAYYRLLLSEVLPTEFSKVLYLDCDLLVKGDLVELWQQELADQTLCAIPDIACPYVDATKGMTNFRKANPYLASFQPIKNYTELGIESHAPYFNSGVMLIDLDRWRKNQISQKLIDCLRENERHIWCWDQYALNAVLHGQWKPLSLQWNMGTHAFEYPNAKYSPVDQQEFARMLDDPRIVHFTTEWKPWHYGVHHPYRNDFFHVLDQTVWRGWRPDNPGFSLHKTFESLMVGAVKRGTILYRKLTSIW